MVGRERAERGASRDAPPLPAALRPQRGEQTDRDYTKRFLLASAPVFSAGSGPRPVADTLLDETVNGKKAVIMTVLSGHYVEKIQGVLDSDCSASRPYMTSKNVLHRNRNVGAL